MLARCLLLLVLSTVTLANDGPSSGRFRGHVLKKNGKYEVVTASEELYRGPLSTDVTAAVAFWDQNYNITGWSVLEIETSENQSNIDQVYAAGLIEGQITRDLIDMQWQNNIADVCDNKTFCDQLKDFLGIQLDWIYDQVTSYPNDPYWHQINLLLVQLNGLIDGYKNVEGTARMQLDDPLGFFLFQIVESIGELAARLKVTGIERQDSCSALIKILPDKSDIFVSHADWSNYRTMLKVIKRYRMPLKSSPTSNDLIPGRDVIFSSYPGTLHSIDDFYMTRPANMTIIETTIVNYNDILYQNIIPISVPEWMRVVVANRLSNSGKDWVDRFFVYNDGTYNNQWMISDFKQFTPGKNPNAGFLTVAEQMVTYYKWTDMTDTLNENSYWASYNNVYFPDFRVLSKEEEQVARKGPQLYSWANSSRANIFRRQHSNVTDLKSMIYMMRFNDFQNDEYSKCDCPPHNYSAELTIAARCDLNDPKVSYPDPPLGYRIHGATDAKITNYNMTQSFSLVAIAGPTSQGQVPFVWSTSSFDKNVSHVGHPDVWNFTSFTPTWMFPVD